MANFPPLNFSCLRLEAPELSSLQAHLAAAKNRPRHHIKPPKQPVVAKDRLASAIVKTQSGTLNLSCLRLDAWQSSSLQAHLATAKNQPRRVETPKRTGEVKNSLASAVNKKQEALQQEASASYDTPINVILQRFCRSHPCHSGSIHWFVTMMKDDGSYDKNYSARGILGTYSYFLYYFMIRKVLASAKKKKKAAAAMSALLRYCVQNKYICGEEVADELKRVEDIGSFDGDALVESIQSLYDVGYWDQLRRQIGRNADGAGHNHDQNEDEADDEGGMIITEVRKDGWMMARDIASYGYDSDDDPDNPDNFFVQLPPDVAARGRVGARFSCMALVLRRGVWSPQGMYDEEYVCANVYPPRVC